MAEKGSFPVCALLPSFAPQRETYTMYLPKGVNLLMLELNLRRPIIFESGGGRVGVKMVAQEHNARMPTVRTLRPKRASAGAGGLKQKIRLPEHFASCAINVTLSLGSREKVYAVRLHVGEY